MLAVNQCPDKRLISSKPNLAAHVCKQKLLVVKAWEGSSESSSPSGASAETSIDQRNNARSERNFTE